MPPEERRKKMSVKEQLIAALAPNYLLFNVSISNTSRGVRNDRQGVEIKADWTKRPSQRSMIDRRWEVALLHPFFIATHSCQHSAEYNEM